MEFPGIVPKASYNYQEPMENDDQHPEICACDRCNRPMKLISSVPKLGGLSELLVFYCGVCDEVTGKSAPDGAPPMWR
jgi:hypothetical protein